MPLESSNTARLLAKLTKNAAEFNRATDSINSLIDRFEDILRNLHLGIETWLSWSPLDSHADTEDDGEGGMRRVGVVTELGFTKRAGEWGLAVRVVVYGSRAGEEDIDVLRVQSEVPLRDASRTLRIAALEGFPKLLDSLNEQVTDVIKKIQATREFVGLC